MTSMGCPYLSSTKATATDSISAVTCMHVGLKGALLITAPAAVTEATEAAATEATEAVATDVAAATVATEAAATELVAEASDNGKELAMDAIDTGVSASWSAVAEIVEADVAERVDAVV